MPRRPIAKTCERCGKDFTTRDPAGRFCGHSCGCAATRPARIPSTQRIPRDRALLYRLYVTEEESSAMIAKRFGVAPISVRRVLRELEIPVRDIRSGHSPATRERIARGHQRRAVLSTYETTLLKALNEHGLLPVPLYAVDRYNIDLAFPESMLAVEVDGGNWHSTEPRKVRQDAAKEAYLADAGWRLLRVKTRRKHWLAEAVAAVQGALSLADQR